MTSVTDPDDRLIAVIAAIDGACERIAPTWPLDRLIAVNPYWGWRELPIERAAGWLGVLGGTSLTMSRQWFRQEWAAGRLTEWDIEAAAAALAVPALADAALHALQSPAPDASPGERMALATDLRDHDGPPRPGQTWAEHVTHQISQHCAAHADRWQASWHPAGESTLYRSWLTQPSVLHAVTWRRGRKETRAAIQALPSSPTEAIAALLGALAVPTEGHQAYLTALLLSINGWASWYAHHRWQARLVGADDDTIVDLLAIRLSWEWLLRQDVEPVGHEAGDASPADWHGWASTWADAAVRVDEHTARQRLDWIMQTAAELAYQRQLVGSLGVATAAEGVAPHPTAAPSVQAVFCIDVRSEVLRRALEAAAPEVTTRGFAGFFGLPISYRPAGTDLERPQLPALLAPSLQVTDHTEHGASLARLGDRRRRTAGRKRRWSTVRHTPTSMFTFVEAAGLLYGPRLLKAGRPAARVAWPPEHDQVPAAQRSAVHPRLTLMEVDPEAAAGLAARILEAMGLTDGFAPLVLLCGHGAEAANNAQLAGLHCGACGGHRGDINARALADLLNSQVVRRHLATQGITIPTSTQFVAGLHNTTTDEVSLFDTDAVPAQLRPALAQLRGWLDEAGRRSRAERAPSLGLDAPGEERGRRCGLQAQLRRRAADWSQVRPEWGLAGNAAFIVAPRARTRGVDLGGRAFLHDYDWRVDPQGAQLSSILTAPMVVTNWINLQYHASTVDNVRYGSGNKALHNVVGGHIGVFEGNGGDLRTGLAVQSLHDGEVLRHPPLRLSVLIEAPRKAIDAVIAGQPTVRALVGNGWLHLLRIDEHDGRVERWTHQGWAPFEAEGKAEGEAGHATSTATRPAG